MLLEDVAYYPRLLTTLVALRELRKKGIYWNNQKDPTSLYRRNHTLICSLKDIHGQYVLEHNLINAFKGMKIKGLTII
jgi:hypothetical protein